jgi:hypothetical protein
MKKYRMGKKMVRNSLTILPVFLLVFPDYYDDGFHGRRGGDLMTTLGISGYCMIFDLVLVLYSFLERCCFGRIFSSMIIVTISRQV